MEQSYIDMLSDQLTLECNTYGQGIEINGHRVNAIVSTSPTTKNMQVAGFYKHQTLDVILPLYAETPKLSHTIVFKAKTYQVRQIEEMEYSSGYRITMELVP